MRAGVTGLSQAARSAFSSLSDPSRSRAVFGERVELRAARRYLRFVGHIVAERSDEGDERNPRASDQRAAGAGDAVSGHVADQAKRLLGVPAQVPHEQQHLGGELVVAAHVYRSCDMSLPRASAGRSCGVNVIVRPGSPLPGSSVSPLQDAQA